MHLLIPCPILPISIHGGTSCLATREASLTRLPQLDHRRRRRVHPSAFLPLDTQVRVVRQSLCAGRSGDAQLDPTLFAGIPVDVELRRGEPVEVVRGLDPRRVVALLVEEVRRLVEKTKA